MITVFLRGGLGNQMFQYALGLNLAKRHKTGLLLDTTFLNDRFPRKQFTYRTYDLDVFNIQPSFTVLSKISTSIPVPGLWLGTDLALIKLRDVIGIQKMVKERQDATFDSAVLDAPRSSLLYGYWQSPKYFSGIENELREAFRVKDAMQGEAVRLAEEIKNSNSVSLHVRRGDYLLPKYHATYGGETNTSYYDAAIKYVAERVKDPKFFVVSDDIAWCRDNIKPPFPTVYVDDASKGPKSAWHIALMSLCRHNIITNSTFSWWGAWLNQNPEKIVIAPKQWHPGREGDDIVPDAWVKM